MVQIEEQLVQTIRGLTPEKQQTVLDFAKFLKTQTGLTEVETSSIPTENGPINLSERGIGIEQAAELRSRLQTFAEDWDSPEMSVYDEI